MNIQTTEHKFEVPWNGDFDLVKRLQKLEQKDKVKFLYLPCAIEDGNNTRSNSEAVLYDRKNINHIVEFIQKNGFNPCILFQRNVDTDCLSFYYSIGIRYFIVGEDKVAHALRDKYGSSVYITASITKDLRDDDYEMYSKQCPDLYNTFVLCYKYSKDIEAVANLPDNLTYTIMPNNTCLWNCVNYRKDWFSENFEKESKPKANCHPLRFKNGELILKNIMYIPPADLWIFDKYVAGYKLVDRMDFTETIVNNFEIYSSVDISEKNDIFEETWNKYNAGHGYKIETGPPIH